MGLLVEGCTFLVDFVEAPDASGMDGGLVDASLEADLPIDDASLDAGPAQCGLYKPDGSKSPCSINLGLGAGYYCACHQLNNYAGSPDDLVQCRTDGSVVGARACANGCANFPETYRDECDNCTGKSGKYCSAQLGYEAGLRIIIICDRGKTFSVDQCSNAGTLTGNCTGTPGSAFCN
ncbi:MAG: hypothetical protein ABIP89_13685 [Polyangiaceae bacterium]